MSPGADLLGVNFQLNQSLLAFGSGRPHGGRARGGAPEDVLPAGRAHRLHLLRGRRGARPARGPRSPAPCSRSSRCAGSASRSGTATASRACSRSG
jgi:hypothetical protein